MIFIQNAEAYLPKDNITIEEISNNDISNEELFELLKLAKTGNDYAKEKIISKYYGYIVFQTKGIFINSYSFEDLIQTGIQSILNSINIFNMDKPISSFSSYVFLAIKNNFNYLCRKEIRYNQIASLNIVFQDGLESIDFIPSPENIEEVIVNSITSKELLFKCQLLDKEELDLINFLYLDSYFENKRFLSDYAKATGKDYYYCVVLKKRALKKLKEHYK